ncbi:MAG: cytochrome b/b6 domain-containing protein [Bacteroidales bacterium]
MSSLYLYPKWVRLWHLFNAILFIILIVTGLSMQYTGKHQELLMVGFAKSVRWHNVSAVLLLLNYIFFVVSNLLTENQKYYHISRKDFLPELWIQLRYYAYGMFKGEKHPFPITEKRKFNPLQKFTYVLAMYVAMPLLIISGIGLLLPEITITRFLGVSGLILTDLLHITMGFLLSVFMIIHIYTCTLGSKPLTLFRGMISGFHESDI